MKMNNGENALLANRQGGLQTLVKYFLLIALVVVAIVFGIARPEFFALTNLMNILRTASVLGILTLSMTTVMTTGDMNFAIGVQATIAGAIVGRLMASDTFNIYPLAVAAAIGASVLIGAITAFFVIHLRVPAFIGTLALQIILQGFAKRLTDNKTLFSDKWTESYTAIGQGFVFEVVPIPVIIFVVVAIVMWIYTEKTRSGRYLFALGANSTACLNMGIKIRKEKLKAYLISGVLAGMVGVIQTSISYNVSLTLGSDMLLPAISGTMLGATFLTPGKYNVAGSVVAALLLVLVQNGVMSLGGSLYVKDIFQGAILMVAMGIIAKVRKEGLPSVKFDNG